MRLVNSGALPKANNAKFQLPKLVAFDDYKICERMRTEVVLPLTVDATGSVAFTATEVLNILRAIFATVTMFWGDQAKDMIDNGLSFDRLRELHIACTQRDIPVVVVSAAGVVQFSGQLSAMGTLSLTASTIPTVTMELIRPFVYERFGTKQTDFCPGPTQMRSIDYSFTRGPIYTSADTHVTENAASSVSIIFDDDTCRVQDRWAQVIRLLTTSISGQVVPGPDEGGALLALYEYSAPLATTALKNFTLYADAVVLHDQIQPSRVGRDEYERLPLGSLDLNTALGTTCTVLYDLLDSMDLSDVPAARKYVFRQATLDIAQPQLGWVMAPPITETYRDNTIGPNAQGPNKRTVKLVNAASLESKPPVAPSKRALQPVGILTTEHPAYATTAGRLFQKGVPPTIHIPEALTSQVHAVASSHGDNSDSALHQAVVHASASIPGANSITKGESTPTLLAAFGHMASGNKGSDTSSLTNFVASLKHLV